MALETLLPLLASGETVSGVELAARAGLTRAAIWKQIETLRALGLPVASSGAGYRAPWPLQLLDPARIRAALGGLEVHWQLDSTSSELQRHIAAAADLSMVFAETQSAGRGRRGRPSLSPPGLNIHLSCLKRFDAGFAALSGLSLAIGVMVLRALEQLGIAGAGLKWPNDVLAAEGKLAGVLVELSGEYQGPCAAVIGVGLNVRLTPQLREQARQPVSDLATLAGGTAPDRNRVAAALVGALIEGLRAFERHGFGAFAADFARYDLLHGQPLTISGGQGDFEGIGDGVDGRGALQVRVPGGETRKIDSADVSVRRA
jgi:BirA family biotin operon repressor/biotin-[acetyl-CoA-carboxylase] ligase